jgi:hypothetical protein
MIGSFQHTANRVPSENPLEEVWAQTGRVGTTVHLAALQPDNPAIPWAEYREYAKVRIHQALEFRAAAHASTLLTAPLPLYYAFLNLMRANLALIPEIIPQNAHGLKFHKSSDLLASEAEIVGGTFTDYLDARKLPYVRGSRITLRDALGCIAELNDDVRNFDPTMAHLQLIVVEAIINGPVHLHFRQYDGDFSTTWADRFPTLAAVCSIASPQVLLVQPTACENKYESICDFLHQRLLNNLTLVDNGIWWELPRSNVYMHLDRIGYYHVAAFILGSVVRYQPELLLGASNPDSGVGWLLKRFLQRAERFYPQLHLSYGAAGIQLYF